MTMPNRAFACAATSLGRLDDHQKFYPTPSIFGSLSTHQIPWKIYGYSTSPLARLDFPDTKNAPVAHYGLFTDFQADAAADRLPAFAFLEPSWGPDGNSQHPNYDVARGEQLLLDTYRALRTGPGWEHTLLIITYDEHGGCYDHVHPPTGATPPDASPGQFGFDFTRYGLRVPTVLVSPLIPAGTVFRAPPTGPPLDHTSIPATLHHRWSLPALTARDAAAPDIGAVLSLTTPRTDDPLADVIAPTTTPLPETLTEQPSHLQQVHAALAADLPIPDHPDLAPPSALRTAADYTHFINQRIHAWDATTAHAAVVGASSSKLSSRMSINGG
jgi:phospholipase C